MASKILVINSGSSSLKFKVFLHTQDALTAVASGVVERIKDPASTAGLTAKSGAEGQKQTTDAPSVKDHVSALAFVMDYLKDSVSSNIKQDVKAIGHRVVHGKDISEPVLITEDVQQTIMSAAALAPLHNPPALQGIQAAHKVFPSRPQVAVFDTAFHQTMPPYAFMYALPYHLYSEGHVRRYGFHGTSYKYILQQASQMLGKPASSLNLVACHLGAGASMCAIERGKCMDTSMGLTPLEGLMMGTRSGDLDPAVLSYLVYQKLVPEFGALDGLLNKQSGFKGIAGNTDLRAVKEGADAGDERCRLALDMFVHRIRKYLGAYLVHLKGRVDAVVFSAGIGENSSFVRRDVLEGLQDLGLELDDAKNEAAVGKPAEIQAEGSRIKVLVVPTDEELSIAQQTLEVLRKQQ